MPGDRFNGKRFHFHFAKVCLNQIGRDHADKHHNDADHQQPFGAILNYVFHFVPLSFFLDQDFSLSSGIQPIPSGNTRIFSWV